MKLYCPFCNVFVAEIKDKMGHIRKGAQVVCGKCLSKYDFVDKVTKLAKTAKSDATDVIRDFFGMKK